MEARHEEEMAHDDGSDRFANSLEEAILDLQAMDQENKRKQKERRALHEKQRQEMEARHEEEMRSLRESHANEIVLGTQPLHLHDHEQVHFLTTPAATEVASLSKAVVLAPEAGASKVVVEEYDEDLDDQAVRGQPAWRFVLFLIIGAVVVEEYDE